MDTLIATEPDAARAHQALAENLAALRRVPEAEKEYRAALRLRPDTTGIHMALGVLYSTAGDWAKAEPEFAEEARMQPGDSEAAYRHGYALLENGKTAEAFDELSRADKLRPDMPETLYALGKAASLLDKIDDALEAWKRLLAAEDRGSLAAQAHFGMAGLYRKHGDPAAAAREMAEFNKLQAEEKGH
jgi:tetratricopeptide (TPR) repeat protein